LIETSTAHTRNKLISSALIALCFFQSLNAFGWGNEGHEYVNRVAAERIPAEMPRFLRHAVAELTYLGPEPDRWRSPSEYALKNAQEPDHYIDLERVEWLDPLPPGRYELTRATLLRLSPTRSPESERGNIFVDCGPDLGVCTIDLLPIGTPRRDWLMTLISDGMVIVRHPDLDSCVEIADRFATELQLYAY